MRRPKKWQPSYYPMGVDPYCQPMPPMPMPRTVDEVEDIIIFYENMKEAWEKKAKEAEDKKKPPGPPKIQERKFTFLETLGLLVPLYLILTLATKMAGIQLP